MNKTSVLSAHVVAGEFNGKAYKSGRLLTATYKEGSKIPAYLSLVKCSAEIAESVVLDCPIDNATIYYDGYKNVVAVHQN